MWVVSRCNNPRRAPTLVHSTQRAAAMVRCNWCLVLSAVVIGILSLAALVTSLDASARLATEIVDLSASSEQPVPCGIATPNLFALAESAALDSMVTRRDGVADTIRAALCTQADAASAIKDLIKGAPATNDAVEDEVCKRNTEGGDPLVRIKRAYLRSGTAFARYHVGSAAATLTADDDCAWRDGPFGVDCPKGETVVRAELRAAAAVNPIYGGGDAMPDTTVALYRLAALALLAHEDRARGRVAGGEAACFGNVAGTNATHLCETVFDADGTPSVPSGGSNDAASAFNRWYAVNALKTCPKGEAQEGTYAVTYTDEPVVMDADKRQCERQHAFALYDTRALFGMPDFNSGPRFDEPRGGATPLYGRYEELVRSWYSDKRSEITATSYPQQRDLMLYAGARLAISLFWGLAAVQLSCFWIAYAGLPTAISTWRLVRWLRTPRVQRRERPVSIRAPMGPARIAATVCTAVFFLWVTWVHPAPSPSTPTMDADCGDFLSTGAVHGSSDSTRSDAQTVADYLLIILIYSLAYYWLLRRETKSFQKRLAPIWLEAGMVTVAGALVGFEGALIRTSLDKWLDAVKEDEDLWTRLPELGKAVDDDVRSAVAIAAGGAAAASSVSQAYLLINHPNLKVPWTVATGTAASIGLIVKLLLRANTQVGVDMFDGDERQRLSSLSLVSQAAMVGGVAIVGWKLIRSRAEVDPVAQAEAVEEVVAEAKEKAQEQAMTNAKSPRAGTGGGSTLWQAMLDNIDWFQSSAGEVEGALPLLAFKT